MREAHPGERIPQPRSFDEKLAHARAYLERDAIAWPVVVDDLDGTLHRALGRMPDAAYVIDRGGRIAGRVLWSNDAAGLERMVRAVLANERPDPAVRHATVAPLVRGLGVTSPVLDAAGRSAGHDMLVTAPPIYLLARVAARFRSLAPNTRGVAAIAVVAIAALSMLAAVARVRLSAASGA